MNIGGVVNTVNIAVETDLRHLRCRWRTYRLEHQGIHQGERVLERSKSVGIYTYTANMVVY